MARKTAVSTEITQETKAVEPRTRVAKPRAAHTRVKTGRHAKGSAESIPEPKENAHETIARLAYGYWEARGGEDGNAMQDWLRAEHEYRAEANAGRTASATA